MSKGMNFAIDGTSALKPECIANRVSSHKVQVKAVRCGAQSVAGRGAHAKCSKSFYERAQEFARSVLDGSEMYCSLKYEDYRGCEMNPLSKKDSIALGCALTFIAVLSLGLGC